MADPADDQPEDSEQERNWRKLEDRAKKAEERVSQLERQVAFTEAGLTNLSDKQVKALVATHDGEMTAEALKATATELGFAPKGEAEQEIDDEQTQALAEAKELGQITGTPSPAGGSEVYDEATLIAKFAELRDSGTKEEIISFLAENDALQQY